MVVNQYRKRITLVSKTYVNLAENAVQVSQSCGINHKCLNRKEGAILKICIGHSSRNSFDDDDDIDLLKKTKKKFYSLQYPQSREWSRCGIQKRLYGGIRFTFMLRILLTMPDFQTVLRIGVLFVGFYLDINVVFRRIQIRQHFQSDTTVKNPSTHSKTMWARWRV